MSRDDDEITADELLRFWGNVAVRGPDECWLWGRGDKGYGSFSLGSRNVLPHRLSYSIHYGDPGQLVVCHECDTPRCVNPRHLKAATQAVNIRDAAARGRIPAGIRNGMARHSDELLEAVRDAKACNPFLSRADLAAAFGLSRSYVGRVLKGRRSDRYDPASAPARLGAVRVQAVMDFSAGDGQTD